MYDAATGLYYASARWYDPATGQFMSRDPTGFAAGDANLDRYVGDNPATMTDPWGLSGGAGGNGTWDPGYVSPLMPMIAPDTPCDGPMVTEMGRNVPSPLMPMIAPDTPFVGPMVNEIDASAVPHYTGELRYSDLDGAPTSFVNMLDAETPKGPGNNRITDPKKYTAKGAALAEAAKDPAVQKVLKAATVETWNDGQERGGVILRRKRNGKYEYMVVKEKCQVKDNDGNVKGEVQPFFRPGGRFCKDPDPGREYSQEDVLRGESDPDWEVIGTWHTHPHGDAIPSHDPNVAVHSLKTGAA